MDLLSGVVGVVVVRGMIGMIHHGVVKVVSDTSGSRIEVVEKVGVK